MTILKTHFFGSWKETDSLNIDKNLCASAYFLGILFCLVALAWTLQFFFLSFFRWSSQVWKARLFYYIADS